MRNSKLLTSFCSVGGSGSGFARGSRDAGLGIRNGSRVEAIGGACGRQGAKRANNAVIGLNTNMPRTDAANDDKKEERETELPQLDEVVLTGLSPFFHRWANRSSSGWVAPEQHKLPRPAGKGEQNMVGISGGGRVLVGFRAWPKEEKRERDAAGNGQER